MLCALGAAGTFYLYRRYNDLFYSMAPVNRQRMLQSKVVFPDPGAPQKDQVAEFVVKNSDLFILDDIKNYNRSAQKTLGKI